MQYYFYFLVFLFGLSIGSFLNALIWRLMQKESMMGRSYCPECRHQLAWYDNIPLFSFAFLRGKCRYCHKPISFQYPIVELVTALLFFYAYYYNLDLSGAHQITNYKLQITQLLRNWFLIAVMMVVFVIDFRWYLILDVVSLPASAIIFGLNLFIGNTTYNLCRWENLWSCNQFSWSGLLISGIIGLSFFLLQFLVSNGKWIGGGDIRLGLLMGLALGWPYVIVAIFMAYIAGSIFGLSMMMVGKKEWGSKLPFGCFLAPATIVTLFWGKAVLFWYINIFS